MKKYSQINGLLSPMLQRMRFGAALPFLKGGSFLDIGCSQGEIIKHLPEGSEYTGIEGNKDYFQAARQQNPGKKFINLYLDEENAKHLDVGRVDVIIALAVIEHMENPVDVLSAMRRYLKPGGRIIISTPSKKSELVLRFGSKLRIFTSEMHEHKKQFSKDELFDMVKRSGYRVELYKSFEIGMNHLIVIRPCK